MKKIFKLAVCLLMAMTMVACGGSSTDKQETVVKNFFDYLKAGDIEKLSTVCTKDNNDVEDLTSMLGDLEEYMDVETYGQTFVDEADKFISHVFSNYVTSYEINSVEEDGDNYLVIVDVKMKDYENLDITSGTEEIMSGYYSEILEISATQDQDALEKLLGDLSTDLFTAMKKTIDDAEPIDTQLRFTLTPDGDNWLISTIEQKVE